MKFNFYGGLFLSAIFFVACKPDAAVVDRCNGACPGGKSCDNNTANECSFDWSAADPCALSAGSAFCITYDDEEYAVHCGVSQSATNCSAVGTECKARSSGGTWYSGCDGVQMPSWACTGNCPGGSECGESWTSVAECAFSWSPESPCPDNAADIFCIKGIDGTYAVECNKSPAVVTPCALSEVCFVDTQSQSKQVTCMVSETLSPT